MKNAVFWGIKTQVLPHRKNIITPLQSPTGGEYEECRLPKYDAVWLL
jgi:hypothetical protein